MTTAAERDAAQLQRARDLAFAEALGGMSRVAATLSSRLREMHDPVATGAVVSASSGTAADDGDTSTSRLPRGGFGPRQTAALALGGFDTADGLSAREVATSLGLQPPNAYTVLRGLERLGLLARVTGARPARWRRSSA